MPFLRFWVLSVKIFTKMDKIIVSDGLKKYLQLWAEYSDIFNLEHLKWHMAVSRPFILCLYGVAGVLIEYSAHNCRNFDFIPSETIIFVTLGHFFTLWTRNTRNGLSPTPQMAYGSYKTIYTESIWSSRCSNWIFCSQLQIFLFYTLWDPNFCHFGTFFSHLRPRIQ